MSVWSEVVNGVVGIWNKEAEEKIGVLGSIVYVVTGLVLILAAVVGIHLLGWVLFQISNLFNQ